MRNFSLILLGALLSSPMLAQVYEWYDDAGKRHFSDQEPVGVVYRVLGDPAENLSSYAPTAIRQPRSGRREARAAEATAARANRAPAASPSADPDAICSNYLARIDTIQDRLRSGYDEPTGNRLRASRRALQSAYWRDCN